MLNHLNAVNDVKIYSVFDDEFKTYGKVVENIDFSELISIAESNTSIPEGEGNIYFPSLKELEDAAVFDVIQRVVYGDMPIQIGYCNGRNTTYNGFEYHKGSELNIAVTDFMLVLGHVWQIENNEFLVGNERVFFVPKGTAIEMYQTTLHLSPCRVNNSGFMDIVVLPKGTNTPVEKTECDNLESKLLLQRNKWVIAHKDRKPLVDQGAYIGLVGENKKLNY